MKASADFNVSDGLSAERRQALLKLLTDEDPAIYQTIRETILSYGQPATDWLLPHSLSSDAVLRRRVQEIVRTLGRKNGDDRFLLFCLNSGEDLDLELGSGLLAQTQFPDINLDGYTALYDEWAGELKGCLDIAGEPEKLLADFNQFMFQKLQFKGMQNYNSVPEASYLNCVVDSRAGNPISLCAVYLFLSRRLCLPITGIGFQGHFICRYQSPRRQIYVDIYDSGRLLSTAACFNRLVTLGDLPNNRLPTPATPKRMLTRMCANLHQAYSLLEMQEEVERIQRYLVALAH